MAIMKASDLLQEMINMQWKEYIEPALKEINKEGSVYFGFEENSNISENLLKSPAFSNQLQEAGYDVYLSQDEEIIRGISWGKAMDGVRGKEIYPKDDYDDDELVHLEGGSCEDEKIIRLEGGAKEDEQK